MGGIVKFLIIFIISQRLCIAATRLLYQICPDYIN